MRDGHQDSQHHGQNRPHWQERIGDKCDQDELPHALFRGRRRIHPHRAQGERAAEERESEAEEQRQVDDLLELSHLQVLDISYDKQGEEDDTVHRMGPLGDGEAGAGKQLHHGQRGGHGDEDGQGFEGGRLLQFQVVVLEQGLQLLAVELVLADDGGQGDARWTVTSLPPGFDFLKRYFLHVSAIHKLNTCSQLRSSGTVGSRSDAHRSQRWKTRTGSLEGGTAICTAQTDRWPQGALRSIHRLMSLVQKIQPPPSPSCSPPPPLFFWSPRL